MKKTIILVRSMDGPVRVLGHLMSELRRELDKTAKDIQQEFSITKSGVKGRIVKAIKGR